jgi:hypothetical protein
MKNILNFDKLFEYRSLENLLDKEAFTTWFSESKVLDKDGKPLVVYHATTNEFDEFTHSYKDTNTDIVNNHLGFYFTDTPSTGDVYISKRFDPKKGYRAGAAIMPYLIRIENPIYLSERKYWQMQRDFDAEEVKDYKERLMITGYDGIIWEQSVWRGDKSGRDYTVFEPEQARSLFSF